MVGRKPKPNHLKLLAGNPGKRNINDSEPKPELKIPPCPAHLNDEAKKEWRRISRSLHKVGLLSVIDKAALASYCQAWGRWIEAEEKLKLTGIIVKTKTGFPVQSPYLAVANKAMDQMQKMLAEFGMSPSSRARIRVQDSGANDPLGDFLNGL